MKSKKPLFDKTLIKKALAGLWPIWTLAVIIGFLVAFSGWFQFGSMYSTNPIYTAPAVEASYYSFISGQLISLSFIYNAVIALGVYGFLFSKRSIIFMHSLPFSRTTIFASYTLAGLLMSVCPMLFGILAYTLLWATKGIFVFNGLWIAVLVVIAVNLIFFALAALAAMLSGRVISFVVMYGILNFFFSFAEYNLSRFQASFLYGVNTIYGSRFDFLSPLVQLFGRTGVKYEYADAPFDYYFTAAHYVGLPVALIYGLVGIIILVLCWGLYKKRRSEMSSEMLAHNAMKPVLLYGFGFVCTLQGARIMYGMFVAFYTSVYSLVPMMIMVIVCGAISFFVGSMIINRDVHVFEKKYYTRFMGFTVFLAAFTFLVSMDIFGIEKKIPACAEIAQIDVNINGNQFSIYAEDALFDMTTDLHRAVIERGPGREMRGAEMNEAWYGDVCIDYTRTDGTRLRREYNFPIYEANLGDKDSIESKIVEYINLEPIREKLFFINGECNIESIDIEISTVDGYVSKTLDPSRFQGFIDALYNDLREKNISETTLFSEDWDDQNTYVYIDGTVKKKNPSNEYYDDYRWTNFSLKKEMIHTVEYLQKECGIEIGEIN